MQVLRAFICFSNLKFLNLQGFFVLEQANIFSKGLLIQTTPVRAMLAASSCSQVGLHFTRMLLFCQVIFPPGQFDGLAS